MIKILKVVELAENCFLTELLYWLALKRFPLAIWDREGGDFRFSCENGLYASFDQRAVSYSECELAGLPANPRYRREIEGEPVDDSFLEEMKEYIDSLSGVEGEDLIARRHEAVADVKEIEEWDGKFEQYLDYFKSRIYLDLRDGRVNAHGIKMKGKDAADIDRTLEADDLQLCDQGFSSVDQNEWAYSRIDWKNSILYGLEYSYCWIRFDVAAMFSTYPIPELSPIGSVRKLCDSYILEVQNQGEVPHETRRGRPPLNWEPFHVEVAALAKGNALPDKKEAAIRHFEEWFRDNLGVPVGRTSIGQKLTPYYDRLIRSPTEIGSQ